MAEESLIRNDGGHGGLAKGITDVFSHLLGLYSSVSIFHTKNVTNFSLSRLKNPWMMFNLFLWNFGETTQLHCIEYDVEMHQKQCYASLQNPASTSRLLFALPEAKLM